MTEHLPECPTERCCVRDEEATMFMCICFYLRACEERMLDAAREAVSDIADRWDHWTGQCVMSKAIDGQYIDRDDALAVIDALREKQ